MGRHSLATTVSVVTILAAFSTTPTQAQDLQWQVENPFRFFKSTRSFALHEAAYNAVRGNGEHAARRGLAHRAPAQRSRLPGLLVARPLRGDGGQALSAEPARLGGADARRHLLRPQFAAAPLHRAVRARPIPGARRAKTTCCPRRTRSPIWIRGREARRRDRRVQLDVASAPRRRQGRDQEAGLQQPAHHRARSVFARRATSGVSVAVTLPDGRQLSERDVVVEDIFIVALGDSLRLRRKQSRPAGPVQPVARDGLRPDAAARRGRARGPQPEIPHVQGFGLSSSDPQVNPKVLPRRLMEDELAERFLRLSSPEFRPPSTRRRRSG